MSAKFVFSLRLDKALVAKVDRAREAFARRTPGFPPPTRSAMIRALLALGADQFLKK